MPSGGHIEPVCRRTSSVRTPRHPAAGAGVSSAVGTSARGSRSPGRSARPPARRGSRDCPPEGGWGCPGLPSCGGRCVAGHQWRISLPVIQPVAEFSVRVPGGAPRPSRSTGTRRRGNSRTGGMVFPSLAMQPTEFSPFNHRVLARVFRPSSRLLTTWPETSSKSAEISGV